MAGLHRDQCSRNHLRVLLIPNNETAAFFDLDVGQVEFQAARLANADLADDEVEFASDINTALNEEPWGRQHPDPF